VGRLPKQDLRSLLNRFELCIFGKAGECCASERDIETFLAEERQREAKQREFETRLMLCETRRMESEARIKLYEAQVLGSVVRIKLAVVQRMETEARLEALHADIESRLETSRRELQANLAAEQAMQGSAGHRLGTWRQERARLELKISNLGEILAIGTPLYIPF